MYRTIGRVLLIATALTLFVVPIAAIGAGSFEDVPDDHVFTADIGWLASVGVTKGCNPPQNTKYCPDSNVTRGQMAAFMHRLADGVVDADTVDGMDAAGFAAAVHDHDGTYPVKTAKAADSDKLDGKDSIAYTTFVFGVRKDWGFTTGIIPTAPSFGELLTVSHTALSSGYVSLTYSASLSYQSAATSFLVGVAIDDQTCASVIRDTMAYGSIDTGTSFDTVASSTILAASAGSHTYSLCANTASGDVALVTASIQGLFATEGFTANVPLGTSAASPESPYGSK